MFEHAIHIAKIVGKVVVAIYVPSKGYGAHCCELLSFFQNAVVVRNDQVVGFAI